MKLFKISTFLIICFISCDSKSALDNPTKVISNLAVDQYEVSIGEFAKFISITNYNTTADSLGWSGYFDPEERRWTIGNNANWERPDGVHKISPDHPVTQVSYYDACNYCKWKGGRLPTAEEWDEIAGDSIVIGNVWQGIFPYHDEGKDNYRISVSPRGMFDANKHGLFDVFGNVWEWTSTVDSTKHQRIIKGGSFLCDFNVCSGFIPAKYQTTDDDSGLNHLGFRCVYDHLL